MKKVLLASTALVAISGAALANENISLSGSAEMGVKDTGVGDAVFHKDADVSFTLSSTTDAGLTFGTGLNFDDDGGGDNYAVHVGGQFGTVTLGDTDGAFDWALTEVDGAGSIADDQTSHDGMHGGNDDLDGSNILRYDNSFGGMGVALSFEQDKGAGDIIGVGVTGSFGDFDVGAGFQSNDDSNIAGVSVMAEFGGIGGGLNFSRLSNDNADDLRRMSVGGTYTEGAVAVHVNFGQNKMGDTEDSGFGVAAQYDMGGAKVQFGYGNSDNADDTMDKDTWSLGLKMSF